MEAVQTLLKKEFFDEVVKVELWRELLKKSIASAEQLSAVCKGNLEKEKIAEVIKKYPMRINILP